MAGIWATCSLGATKKVIVLTTAATLSLRQRDNLSFFGFCYHGNRCKWQKNSGKEGGRGRNTLCFHYSVRRTQRVNKEFCFLGRWRETAGRRDPVVVLFIVAGSPEQDCNMCCQLIRLCQFHWPPVWWRDLWPETPAAVLAAAPMEIKPLGICCFFWIDEFACEPRYSLHLLLFFFDGRFTFPPICLACWSLDRPLML